MMSLQEQVDEPNISEDYESEGTNSEDQGETQVQNNSPPQPPSVSENQTTVAADRQGVNDQLYSFGQNSYGELALGDSGERTSPEVVQFFKDRPNLQIVQVVAGNEHTAILCSNGEVYTCGYNDSGQCGIGHTNRVNSLQLVDALSDKNIVDIFSSNGCESLTAVSSTGRLYTCGYNARGQLGHGMTEIVSQPKLVRRLRSKRVVKVACSYHHSLIATDEHEVFAFGRNDYGQLGIGDTIDRAKPQRLDSLGRKAVHSLACGQYHTIFSIQDRGVLACGKNDYGQLGIADDRDPRQVPVSSSSPLDCASDSNWVTQVACGYYHSLALTNTGIVYGFGRNDDGQLGLNNNLCKTWPHIVESLAKENIVEITCGCYHSLFLTDAGSVYGCGRNNHLQLGFEMPIKSYVPVVIDALSELRITKIAAGFYHTLCVASASPKYDHTNPMWTLNAHMKKLLNSSTCSDVTFVINDIPVYAHRCIIAARCEPLKRMLTGPMRESGESEIVLHDVEYESFLGFLEFIYTDSVEALEEDSIDLRYTLDLFAVADKYLLEPLKNLCNSAIQRSITPENVAYLYAMAYENNAVEVRDSCFDYCLKHFGRVIGTESFSDLPKELLREVLNEAQKRGVSLLS